MRIEIVIHSPHKKFVYFAHSQREANNIVYGILIEYGVDVETAIDCASWAELAVYGDSCNEENFDVYIDEDD